MSQPGQQPARKLTWSGRAAVECEGKDKLTRARAKDVERRMRAKDRTGTVNAYRCTCCGHWHVGSTNSVVRTQKKHPKLFTAYGPVPLETGS